MRLSRSNLHDEKLGRLIYTHRKGELGRAVKALARNKLFQHARTIDTGAELTHQIIQEAYNAYVRGGSVSTLRKKAPLDK